MAIHLLALRNLLRNRRRSLIALGTLVFGVVALLLAGGFIEWIFWAMRESTIESRLGHIQVVRAGYFQAGAADPFAYRLPEDSAEMKSIGQMPQVKAVAPRLAFTGLAGFGDNTVSFVGEGVDPAAEQHINRFLLLVAGRTLATGDSDAAILGNGLARNLGAKVGDRISLLAKTASGGVNAIEVTVRGLFATSTKAFDDTALRIPISTARSLVRADGSHLWVLALERTEQTPAVIEALTKRFSSDTARLEFSPWFDLADFYNKTVRLFSRQVLVVKLIIAVIVFLTISNTATMNVLERTTEIGMLMALGFRQASILQLFLTEGLILGVIGGIIGITTGWTLAQLISAIGIPMPPPPGMDVGFVGEVLVTTTLIAHGFLLAAAGSTLATAYPAWKASRLRIVDALRRSR